MSNLFIISGPSGAGEDSVIKGLKEILPIEKVVTTTTREMRPGEVEGVDYYFISPEDFEKNIKENKFFEFAQEYNNRYYGVTHDEINRVLGLENKIGIWKIEYKGVISAKKLLPQVKSIMINAPLEILVERIKKRGDMDQAKLEERIEYTKEWQKNRDIYDHIVDNEQGKLAETIKKVANIIKKGAKL